MGAVSTPPGDPAGGPHLRILHGQPSGAEVAALVAVLAARAAAAAAAAARAGGDRPARSAWADPSRRLRTPPHPGPDAWRRSALPS
jgi:hypothetical protein